MGSFSIWHWMLFGAVALLLFGGKGKISDLMGDVAKGIKSFKKGMAEDDRTTSRSRPPRCRSKAAARPSSERKAEGQLTRRSEPKQGFGGRARGASR